MWGGGAHHLSVSHLLSSDFVAISAQGMSASGDAQPSFLQWLRDEELIDDEEFERHRPRSRKRQLKLNSSDEDWLLTLCRARRSPNSPHAGSSSASVSTGAPASQQSVSDESPPHQQSVSDEPSPHSVGGQHCPASGGQEVFARDGPGVAATAREVGLAPLDPIKEIAQKLASLHLPLPAQWDLPVQGELVWSVQERERATDALVSASDADFCIWRTLSWFRSMSNLTVFKVGIAHDPAHRWSNNEFGYVLERMWMFMDVMVASSPLKCRELEITLIAQLQSVSGCYNIKPGGEGISSSDSTAATAGTHATCYCYVVFAPAGGGRGLHAEWRDRERALIEHIENGPGLGCNST